MIILFFLLYFNLLLFIMYKKKFTLQMIKKRFIFFLKIKCLHYLDKKKKIKIKKI